ncbi:phage tail tube protein [Chelativorans intermedius]|uniref:Phage tail tube protein n=1 Tax=Chelativorans intermedius TaxID=515947 RepID=A0ABV6DD04_9HYPH|nr:phage tail tube protein [Chelativorans intermedius]MCT9000542.1 phage tail tube protein [Chelativorans intermedius]
MARAQGARAQMALAFETTYGTPPVGGFTRMPFASTSLGAEQPLLNSELLGYGRDPLAPINDAVTADGDVVVPLDAEAFGFWLKAAFGDPTTTGTGPWTHEFQSGSWTLPSMSIETGMPEVPRYAMYSGCVLDQLTWQMQRSGLLTATARLVAQGETVGTTTSAFGEPASPPAALELKRFGHFNGSITRNGTALGNVVSAEITYANNLDRIETIRSDGRIDGADPSIAALTGRIEVRFADQTLVSQAINGEACEMEFAYVLPSGESLRLTVHAVYLPRPRIEISGPQGVQATFDWQAARDSVVGRMCTATLVNDVESY